MPCLKYFRKKEQDYSRKQNVREVGALTVKVELLKQYQITPRLCDVTEKETEKIAAPFFQASLPA